MLFDQSGTVGVTSNRLYPIIGYSLDIACVHELSGRVILGISS